MAYLPIVTKNIINAPLYILRDLFLPRELGLYLTLNLFTARW